MLRELMISDDSGLVMNSKGSYVCIRSSMHSQLSKILVLSKSVFLKVSDGLVVVWCAWLAFISLICALCVCRLPLLVPQSQILL